MLNKAHFLRIELLFKYVDVLNTTLQRELHVAMLKTHSLKLCNV